MSRVIQLSGLKQGIQRVREKGGADPDTLYDLVNGYVTIDGGVNQRPGTVEDAELPAGTLGLMAWNNQLVVFSTTVKSGMPDGYRCEVIVHPFFPSTGLSYIWFSRPMMGYPYVVAEFANGDVFHYWLESANSWEASTMYLEGQVIVPSTPNGLAYKAHRTLPKMPTWTAGMDVSVGTKVEPTEENGYYYEATATNEASGVGTPGGPPGTDTPGDPPTDGGPTPGQPDPAELFAVTGSPPDGYVGYPYVLYPSDFFHVTGGFWDANGYGYVVPGVMASGSAPLSEDFRIVGIPTSAGTFTTNLYFDASSPTVGGSGEQTIADSVTIVATPSYSLRDIRFRPSYGEALVDTTPPWTTYDISTARAVHSYGFTSGKRRGQFTITGSDNKLLFGVSAAKGELTSADSSITIATGSTNTASYEATGDGTYTVEVDASTGAWEVFKLGTGSVASGTLALPPGNQYRIVQDSEYVQTYRVKMNFGNEAWLDTPTAGFGGVPFPSVTIPVAWASSSPINGMSFNGSGDTGAIYGARGGRSHISLGNVGKSSGLWRVGLSNYESGRIGITKAGADIGVGNIGSAGTVDGVAFDGTSNTIHWCFSGVAGSQAVSLPPNIYGYVIVAVNFTASTVRFCVVDRSTDAVIVLHEVTGLPAGTYYPAEGGTTSYCGIVQNPPGPSGYSDWVL